MRKTDNWQYAFCFRVELPGGNFCVVTAETPYEIKSLHLGNSRKYWTSYRLFKRERNARRYLDKLIETQRQHNQNLDLSKKGLFNFN